MTKLNGQSDVSIHFLSELANKNYTQIKANVERFCAMTLSSLSDEPINFQSELANKNCTQIKTNVEHFSWWRSTEPIHY